MGISLKDLFDLGKVEYAELFTGLTYPWEVIARLADFLEPLVKDAKDNVIIGEGTVIEPGAVIYGPTIIGTNCRIRSGAYIRGSVLVGNDVVIGHSSEIKNSVIFDGAQIAHFNYIGDSIVGNKAHFAAGAITANTKLSPGEITIHHEGQVYKTGLRKFGSAVGDGGEIGCNAVLNPGSIIGKGSVVYPLISWRGVLEENHIAKSSTEIVEKR